MKSLEFAPVVYKVEVDMPNGKTEWNILTVDGQSPEDTFYFFLKTEEQPSSEDVEMLESTLEAREWNESSLEESGFTLSDFDIIKSFLEQKGDEYSTIKRRLEIV